MGQLMLPEDGRSFEYLDRPIAAGTLLPKPSGVFPRFQDEAEASQ